MSQAARGSEPVRRHAWAKVNLTLHVTGRRADGYHELDSLIVFAGLCDELEARPADDLELTLDGPFAAALAGPHGAQAAADNLVLRAARALRSRFGIASGARMRLTKRLPVAAGLGGGSADAAAALDALAALWGLRPPADARMALGAGLGADVPVCLVGRPSFVAGIGDRIEPAPALPPAWLVLANPGRALATAQVFAARRGPFSRPVRWTGPIADPAGLAARLAEGGNDLEAAARALVPEVGDALAALRRAEGCLLARMSGSGATCFGLFAGPDQAAAAAAALAAEHADWWVRAAPIRDGGAPADS